jgi:uncharacterized lipoprotein YddW (UPF0748 family)
MGVTIWNDTQHRRAIEVIPWLRHIGMHTPTNIDG